MSFNAVYGLLIGLIGSIYIARGFLAKSLEDIIQEACEGRAIGNIYLAKSLIQQKWEIIVGFAWLTISYLLQMLALYPNGIKLFESHIVCITIVVTLFLVSERVIYLMRLKDGCTFTNKKLMEMDVKQTAPLKVQGAYLHSYALMGQTDPEFVNEVCKLLLIKELSDNREDNLLKINERLEKMGGKRLELPSGPLAWQKRK